MFCCKEAAIKEPRKKLGSYLEKQSEISAIGGCSEITFSAKNCKTKLEHNSILVEVRPIVRRAGQQLGRNVHETIQEPDFLFIAYKPF